MEVTKQQILDQLEFIKQSLMANVSEEEGEDFNYEEMENTTAPAVRELAKMFEEFE